jgi:hypothetical protein
MHDKYRRKLQYSTCSSCNETTIQRGQWEGIIGMRKASAMAAGLLMLGVMPAAGQTPPGIAVFDMQLLNTSPAPSTQMELDRAAQLTTRLRDAIAASGRYRVIDIAPVRAELQAGPELRDCNGCELDYARKLGADYAAVSWVQKVSNLILNINVAIEDVGTGKLVTRGSVDIRGNTDESWQHGLAYLLDHRILSQ